MAARCLSAEGPDRKRTREMRNAVEAERAG
jgi:hypothetical protein